MPETEKTTMLTIRPSQAAYKKATISGLPVLAIILVISLVNSRNNLLVWFAIMGLTVIVLLIGVRLYFRNARIESDGHTVTRYTLFGSAKAFPTDSVGATTMAWVSNPSAFTPLIYLVMGHDGRRILQLSSALWLPEDMSALARTIGVEPQMWPTQVTFLTLKERYPLAVRWIDAHRIAFALIVGLGTFLLAIIIVVVALAIIFTQ